MLTPTEDPLLSCSVLSCTTNPQSLVWQALHQCYCPEPTPLALDLGEKTLGEAVVRHLLAGNRGHYSPLEQPSLSCRIAYAPHSLVQQLRTHRHLSFSVQSFRYTSSQFERYVQDNPELNTEALCRLVYFHPNALYKHYTQADLAVREYVLDVVDKGHKPEDARGSLPFDLRQHLVVGGNLRAWWHLLDVRLKPDVQPEFQQLMVQVQALLRGWCPQLQEWYDSKRATRAVLSP